MLETAGVQKRYPSGSQTLHVLRGVDLRVEERSVVALMGPSGVGKSTLLHLVGGLDRPDGGSILVGGRAVHALADAELDRYRRRTVGFVYQSHHLLPEFEALENVMLPAIIDGRGGTARDRAAALLEEVDLAGRAHHLPSKLSGGERQRVALARALMNEPALLLADEPTGNLDAASADHVMALLRRLQARRGLTVLLATHNADLAASCDRVVRLREGKIA